MRSTLVILAGASILSLASFSVGPVDGATLPFCRPQSPIHTYVNAEQGRVTLLRDPVCGLADDPFTGLGGAFLAADHHHGRVCAADDVVAGSRFFIGTDGNGDGSASAQDPSDVVLGPFRDCASLPPAPGVDGGWWVILGADATHGTISTTNP